MTIGILAHVDAGKTTLSEALLYTAGAIRKTGRVDHGDAFLDTDVQEKRRGITIYAKQAVFRAGDTEITLLDTPGHVDFSAETERTLQVLDAAVLVISAPDGVQSHTLTLWKLLKSYRVPVFIFVNKMDQPGAKKERVLEQLTNRLKAGFLELKEDPEALAAPEIQEELAVLDEALMEQYLEEGIPAGQEDILRLIRERKLFPVCFGSALRLEGVEGFLRILDLYAPVPADYPEEFGARIFKITRDEQGNRLTWMKITGGTLKVKMTLPDRSGGETAPEKADQIRQYSGTKFTPLKEAEAGMVVAVTGPQNTRAGEGLGFEKGGRMPILTPVLSYRVLLPDGVDAAAMLPKLRTLEEEEPELHVLWDERTQEIHVQLMGAVQTEVLEDLVERRCGVRIAFDSGSIAYRETIAAPVEGVGHFEPLRHYAEVHLVMEPGEPGSGLVFAADVSVDRLALNWQRLILTHLEEREHPGVLTGSPITDMKITVAAGRAHEKHTEGGDFRQATYRAVRNGLMFAENVLLEPWYEFSLSVPEASIGRAMSDLDRMSAEFSLGGGPEADGLSGDGGPSGSGSGDAPAPGSSVIAGRVPASEIRNYADEVRAYTKGEGQLSLRLLGYLPCHNAEEVIEASGYDPELDVNNSPDSVFCSHGVGTVIPWYDVPEYMHLPPVLESTGAADDEDPDGHYDAGGADGAGGRSGPAAGSYRARRTAEEGPFLSIEEVDAIVDRAGSANRRNNGSRRRYSQRRRYKETLACGDAKRSEASAAKLRAAESLEKMDHRKEYFLVDGYNIIFAWPELRSLAEQNIDSARLALQDRLSDYQGYRGCELIAVFDAYRVAGHQVEIFDYHNIHVVFTKEAQTADAYIEHFSHEHAKTDRVVVATSDGMEQVIVRSAGSELMSAQDLKEDMERRTSAARDTHLKPTAPRDSTMAEKLKELKGLEGLDSPDQPEK